MQAIMVSDNQLDHYFQVVKDMLWKKFISDPLTRSEYCVNQNLPTIQGFDKEMQPTW